MPPMPMLSTVKPIQSNRMESFGLERGMKKISPAVARMPNGRLM